MKSHWKFISFALPLAMTVWMGFAPVVSLASEGIGLERGAPGAKSQRSRAPASGVQAGISYTKLGVRIDQPLTAATGGLVNLSVTYTGAGTVASVQVPGAGSFALGPFTGGFQHVLANVDVRRLLNGPDVLARCTSILDHNKVDSMETAYDALIPVTVNDPAGTVVASTNLPYQLGLICKRPPPPLTAAFSYAKIEVDVDEPLARAKGGLVAMTVEYNGAASIASVQIPGSVSFPFAHQGSFKQTLQNVDIRAALKRDEAAIMARCRSSLEFNKADRIDTAHDSQLPVTVNGPDGGVVASTTVIYQLGLTCTR